MRIAMTPGAGAALQSTTRNEGTAPPPSSRRAELVSDPGARESSTIVAPIVSGRRLLGRMVFTSEARQFAPADLVRAESFARLAALSLESSRRESSDGARCRAYERVLATVAHDLRNPLAVIHGTMFVLKENAGREEPSVRIAVVERMVRLMTSLVSDLLDVTAARAGALRVDQAPEKVGPLVDETSTSLAVLAEARGISLVTDHDDAHAFAYCDAKRVAQVLGNLIGNAIKFSRSGGAITIATRPSRRFVRFSVVDQGPGIAEADLARIFDRFWSGASPGRGAGLGLSIAKSIVAAHGGRIGVTSTPGAGSTFWFTLPTTAATSSP